MPLRPDEIESKALREFVAGKNIEVEFVAGTAGEDGVLLFYKLSGPDAPPGRVLSRSDVLLWEKDDPAEFAAIHERWDAGRPALHRYLDRHDEG